MRTLSGISLLFGALLCIQSAQALPFSGDKKRFTQTANYQGNRRDEGCNSFDFSDSDLGEGDWFEWCEGVIGDDLKCGYGWINTVYENKGESSNWFCVDFTFDPQNNPQQKYLWVTNQGGEAVLASDCKGAPPLSMYRASTSLGMCGMIPSDFQNQFRFKEDNDNDNDKCFSIDFDGSTPKEGSTINQYCDAGDKTCHYRTDPVVMTINSRLGGSSSNWTCVDLYTEDVNPEMSQHQYLWLDESSTKAAISTEDACTVNTPPDSGKQYPITKDTECPKLQFDETKKFNPDTQSASCYSFDFNGMMGVFDNNQQFYWCMTNGTLRAQCISTSISSMRIEENNGDTWFCLDFQNRHDESTSMWVDPDNNQAEMADDCDGTVPTNTNGLSGGRCEGLDGNLIDTLKFTDFDGHCQSFNFTADTTGGGLDGSATSRTMLSTFRYCREGAENWDGMEGGPQKRQCDTNAKVKRIHYRSDTNQDPWYCLEINSDTTVGGKDHLWLKQDGTSAALSSDCQDATVLDFRQSSLTTGQGMCHVLPMGLTGSTFRFWGHSPNLGDEKDCRSFKFDPFISTFDQAITGPQNPMVEFRDDADLFEFCQGTGGRRECTTKLQRSDYDANHRVPDDTSSIGMFNVHRLVANDPSTDWYCVEFMYNFTEITSAKQVSLWMNAGDSSGNGKKAFLSGSDCSQEPSVSEMEVDWLMEGECQVIPSGARHEIRWSQGDSRFLSVDFSDHPGRLAGGDMFEYCVHNGHCFHATVMNVSNPGMADDVCIDFYYTTTYGLDHIYRGVWVNGQSASLVTSCKPGGSANAQFNQGMVERLPGELQDKLSFWQSGTCISFGFDQPPSEQNPSALSYCEDVRHNNWCASTVSLVEVINPDSPAKQNWYCVTLSYTDEYGLEDIHRYVWFNPHHYEWNVGYGAVTKSCDLNNMPSPDQTIPDDGTHVLREGMCQNFPNVHPYNYPHNSNE